MTDSRREFIASTEAGRRLLWMVETERLPTGRRWPRTFEARLTERIVEEFVPRIEEEASHATAAAGIKDETALGYVTLWNDVRPIVDAACHLAEWVDSPDIFQSPSGRADVFRLAELVFDYRTGYPEHDATRHAVSLADLGKLIQRSRP